jgi:hypothetical protein
MTSFLKIFIIMTICIIFMSSIFGCFAGAGKPIEKVGHHLQKIKDINYKLSIKKTDAPLAEKKIMSHMEEIKQLDTKISDNEPIKDLLTSFLNKWSTQTQILGSLMDEHHQFMAEVNVFFIRGYVKYKDGWKTLFPIFKP